MIILILSQFIGPAGAAQKPQADKKICSKLELGLKDCALRLGETKVNLLRENWRMNDSKAVVVQELPITGHEGHWERISLEKFGPRRLLQLWLWSPPSGEGAVQELNWYVLELEQAAAPVRVHEIVRRRHLIAPQETASGQTDRRPASAAPPKFVFDPKEKTELTLQSGKIKWKAGARSGEF